MDIRLNPRTLGHAVAAVKAAVARRAPRRLFECVRVRADREAGEVRLAGTDLEAFAEAVVGGAEVREAGELLLPVAVLEAVAKASKASKAEAVRLEAGRRVGAGFMVVAEWTDPKTGEAVRQTLEGEDPAQYPEAPQSVDEGSWIRFAGLGGFLREAAASAGDDAARYVLNGIAVGLGRIAATDGRRLYCRTSPEVEAVDCAGGPYLMAPDIVRRIPAGLLAGLDRIGFAAAGLRPRVEFAGEYPRLGFRLRYAVRCLEGSYPDVGAILPAETIEASPIDPEAWTRAVEGVEHLCSKDSPCVKVTPGPTGWEVQSKDAAGSASRTIPGEARGPRKPFGINPRYLRTVLRWGPHSIRYEGPNHAVRFDGADGRVGVVMPIMIDG